MNEFQNTNIEYKDHSEDKTYGLFIAEPLERGYGTTLGNALRRVLLSSLPGSAATSVRIEGIFQEYSTVPGVIEDVTEILLNVKDIRARLHVDGPKTVFINKEAGYQGPVRAGEFNQSDELEIINPDLVIAHMNGDGPLFMGLTFNAGVGYKSAEQNKEMNAPIGVIPLDSIFTPVRKVNFQVEDTRVGQVTDYDKLTLEIWTDGTITAEEALVKAAEILIGHLNLFLSMTHDPVEGEEAPFLVEEKEKSIYDAPIEDLKFSTRIFNSLKRADIHTVADLVARSREDLMKVRNLGATSLDELVEKLDAQGLSLAEADQE
ncbi:MAG: DNA-directed RNA polymerase subunit alpha [Clostridiaceae bacterium]|jgi:DNA-directed RNA polymerase subunit alpha|nr:DNA-directed RNA polymerase subunit alpha [Clostridiaceae bacterium]